MPLLELEPGQTFLDVAAAPGNKTAQALESGVRAVACDVSREFQKIDPEAPRMNAPQLLFTALCSVVPRSR